jgi:hypothetical protein
LDNLSAGRLVIREVCGAVLHDQFQVEIVASLKKLVPGEALG